MKNFNIFEYKGTYDLIKAQLQLKGLSYTFTFVTHQFRTAHHVFKPLDLELEHRVAAMNINAAQNKERLTSARPHLTIFHTFIRSVNRNSATDLNLFVRASTLSR